MKLLGAQGAPGQGRHVHAEGRDERGAARLGHERAHDPLRDRSAAGPHPYPTLVRELQAVIGREARVQILEAEGRLPDALVACVGGGSNAIGLFRAFVPDAKVGLFGVEAAGDGIDTHRHAATLARGRVGVLHGARSYVLCDGEGRSRRRTRSAPASTTPASVPSTRSEGHAAARTTSR